MKKKDAACVITWDERGPEGFVIAAWSTLVEQVISTCRASFFMPLRLNGVEELLAFDEARAHAFGNQWIKGTEAPKKLAYVGMPAKQMTGTKDDDASTQVARS